MNHAQKTFIGEVNGGVAARDVVNIHVPPSKPESELQATFKMHTGIHCSREVRGHFEALMEHHGFTAQELARAWNVGSLVWDQERRALKSTSRALDMTAGWLGIALMTIAFVFALLEILISSPQWVFSKPAMALVTGVVYLVVCRFILLSTILPQLTARRAEKTFLEDRR